MVKCKRTVLSTLCSEPSASLIASVAGESCVRNVPGANESTARAVMKQSDAPVSTRHRSRVPSTTICKISGDDFFLTVSDPSTAASSA